jgi:hypothetical protein
LPHLFHATEWGKRVLIADVTPPQGLDSLLPAWAQQLSLLTLLVLIVMAFMRGYVVTKIQAAREVDSERKIADIWKANYEQSIQLNKQLTESFQPVLDSNAAILKAVEAVQARQQAAEERDQWLRDRGDRQG